MSKGSFYPDTSTSISSYLNELHRAITFSTKKAHICIWIIQRNEYPERGRCYHGDNSKTAYIDQLILRYQLNTLP